MGALLLHALGRILGSPLPLGQVEWAAPVVAALIILQRVKAPPMRAPQPAPAHRLTRQPQPSPVSALRSPAARSEDETPPSREPACRRRPCWPPATATRRTALTTSVPASTSPDASDARTEPEAVALAAPALPALPRCPALEADGSAPVPRRKASSGCPLRPSAPASAHAASAPGCWLRCMPSVSPATPCSRRSRHAICAQWAAQLVK